MAVRLKTRWHKSKRSERNREGSSRPKSLDSMSSAVAINIWKLSQDTFKRMEKEDFLFPEDRQAIEVISEFCVYLLHIVDRSIYGRIPEQERGPLINAIAKHLLATIEGNQLDLLGPGDYRPALIERLNDRLANYAECSFDADGPGYDFKRYLGQKVAEIMAAADNKWVVEQIMDIEAPGLAEKIRPVVRDVLGIKDVQ